MEWIFIIAVALAAGLATFAWEVKQGFERSAQVISDLQSDIRRLLTELQTISYHTRHLEPDVDDDVMA